MENTPQQDRLWELAKRRADFKKNLTAYVLVNAFLVMVWLFTGQHHYRHFWPIWPILGWGLGIVIQYLSAYRDQQFFSAEKEYEKLKQR